MEIPYSSIPSGFDFALGYLCWMEETFKFDCDLFADIRTLRFKVRLLQCFDMYLTKCRRRRRDHGICLEQDEEIYVTSFSIQDLIIRRMLDLEFVCSKYWIHSRSPDLTYIKSELTKFWEAIKLFFKTDIKGSCINFLLEYYWLRDPELVIDFIDLVSKTLVELNEFKFHVKRVGKKLMFLKSFICFAMLHNVKGQQLIDLLIHAEVVALNALRLISISHFDRDNKEVCKEIEVQISRLIREKMNAGDSQVRETYIDVLTAAKLSRSSHSSALEKNKHLVVDFMDNLVFNIMDLVESCTSTIMNQMLKVLEGLRFLTIFLRHEEKFKELCHEIKNLIGVVACDAGIVIFSLSVNQIEEGLAKETDLALFHLLKVIKFIRAEVTDQVTSFWPFGFPKINELGSMDFLLENLKELESCNEADDSIAFPKDQIHTVLEDLEFLRSFLVKIVDQRNGNGKLQALWSRAMEVAYRAEFVIDSIVVGDKHEHLEIVARDIQLLRAEASETYDSMGHDCGTQSTNQKSFHIESKCSTPVLNEVLVGLDDEVKTIIDRLTNGSKLLDFVSIVGMAGLGKTTLANRVYNNPLILSHFHILAWCTVSQMYSMHSLLVQLLCSISSKSPDQYLGMDENDLAHMLYKLLKRNRYLLVLDDLWDIGAWNVLERSLPDDANRSRILITSRLQKLSLQFKPDSKVHHLRPLNDEESWKLLQKKLFGKEGCPPRLSGIANQIVRSCRGLPLSIVLVAGILATTAQNLWKEVAKSLSSSTVLDDEYCMKTLELSYSHLPDELKSCLLYLGAFKEDENLLIRRLLWLWISEGFVRKTEGKSLEEVADGYLKDLVDRSLVMVSKERIMGGAKACRLHDLVHEFCVKKAKEENFLHILHSQNGPFILIGPSSTHRVCDQSARNLMTGELMLEYPGVRSLLWFKDDGLGFWLPNLLRVLDLGELEFSAHFLMEVFFLTHLRYLALRIEEMIFVPTAIGNLSRLQTFLLRGESITDCLLPKTIWNIRKLRHLWTTNSDNGFIFPVQNLEVSPALDHLNTLSLCIDPSSQNLQKILTKLPSIRRLKCKMKASREEHTRIGNRILMFDCISQLETLTLHTFHGNGILMFDCMSQLETLTCHRCGFKFPLNLKKLTLHRNYQPWSEVSTIGKLPNLEVLKLLALSFIGEEWKMKEGEFPNLRVLKLEGLDFCSWIASSDNFPCLERLVVHRCSKLEEVPSCLGESENLGTIELKRCRESLVNSVKHIQQEQIEMGNYDLKIVIENCSVIDQRRSRANSRTRSLIQVS